MDPLFGDSPLRTHADRREAAAFDHFIDGLGGKSEQFGYLGDG